MGSIARDDSVWSRLRDRSLRAPELDGIVDALRGSGGLSNVKLCTMVISAYSRQQRWRDALCLLSEMQGKRLDPNVITFNAAISACEKGAEWQQAASLLDVMRLEGLEPDVISYSAAMSACEKNTEWQQALSLLAEMRSQARKPHIYNVPPIQYRIFELKSKTYTEFIGLSIIVLKTQLSA